MALATVGIPFSSERTADLELAIRSVFAQTEADWRLLLVGDAPRPDLVDLCDRISDRRVELFVDGARRGLPSRLNQMISLTESPYFIRMDGDDVMAPDRISKSIAALRDGRADVVGTRAYLIDEANTVRGLFHEAELPRSSLKLLTGSVFSHPTVAGATEWFRSNAYDERFTRAQDKELWARTWTSSRFIKLAEPLMFYRVNTDTPRKRAGLQGRWDRRVIRTRGPGLVGRPATSLLLLRSYARVTSQMMVHRIGKSDAVYNRRFARLPDDQLVEANSKFVAAGSARVDGWAS